MNQHSKLLLLAILFPAVTAIAAPRQQAKVPGWVRLSLADRTITRYQGVNFYDPKAKYYLLSTGDCDGAHLSLMLTPFPHSLYGGEKQDEYAKFESTSLPRLRNGVGVNIGDSPATVERKLGQSPNKVVVTGNERIWTYYAHLKHLPGREGPQNYRATYSFHNSKLRAIQYSLSDEESCG